MYILVTCMPGESGPSYIALLIIITGREKRTKVIDDDLNPVWNEVRKCNLFMAVHGINEPLLNAKVGLGN